MKYELPRGGDAHEWNPPSRYTTGRQWVVLLILACCLTLLATLKVQGLLLVVPIAAITLFILNRRPGDVEIRALRSSLQLSLEDITDTLEQFDLFQHSPDATHLADRTLHRPALLDPDCADPAIERFHYEYAGCRAYVRRLRARLAADLTVAELEGLLNTTDLRAAELRDAWLEARAAAHRLGSDYH